MKQIVTSYAFNTTAKTITLSDFDGSHPVALERLLLIVDTTTNQILYNFADNTIATAAVSSNNVVTLSALPGGVANSDKLQVAYDVVVGDPTYQIPLLPTGAATAAGQTSGGQKTQVVDGSGNVIGSTSNALDINIKSGNPTSITANAGTNLNTSLLALEGGGNLASIKANTDKIPASPAQEHGTAGSPSSTRLSDGTTYYKATTPSDTQPVSAASLPLPTGAATSAKQDTGNTSLASIDTKMPSSPATDRATAASPGAVRLSDGTSFYKSTTPSDTQPVSAASLPLPTGAATSASQSTANTSLSTIATNTGNSATSANQTNGTQQAKVTDGTNVASVLKSDSTAAGQNALIVAPSAYYPAIVTLNVSNPNSSWFDMLNYSGISVSVLTNANSVPVTFQTSADASTNPRSMVLASAGGGSVSSSSSAVETFYGSRKGRYFRLSSSIGGVNTATYQLTFYAFPPSLDTTQVMQQGTWTVQPGNTANTTAWKVDGSAVTQPVSAASLPLPTGAATAAKQPALGTAGTPSSDVLTVQGVTSMTAIKVDGSAVTQPVSGTVSANAGTGTFTIQSNASVNQAQVGGTAIDTNSGTKSAGTQRVVIATDQPQLTNALKVDGSATTQPVSGTVTATPEKGTTATIARVATSTTSAQLLASNSVAKKRVIVNDSSAVLYVKYGTSASATSFTYIVQAGDTLEEFNYTGRIDGILSTGTGNAQATEV